MGITLEALRVAVAAEGLLAFPVELALPVRQTLAVVVVAVATQPRVRLLVTAALAAPAWSSLKSPIPMSPYLVLVSATP